MLGGVVIGFKLTLPTVLAESEAFAEITLFVEIAGVVIPRVFVLAVFVTVTVVFANADVLKAGVTHTQLPLLEANRVPGLHRKNPLRPLQP